MVKPVCDASATASSADCGSERTIETFRQEAITCPHCGHEARDSWEWAPDSRGEYDGEADCGECGATFYCSRILDVSYTTRRMA